MKLIKSMFALAAAVLIGATSWAEGTIESPDSGYAAKIGEQKFETLAAAVSAAAVADTTKTVVLLKDVEESVSFEMAATRPVKLDLNGYTLTGDVTVSAPAGATAVFTVLSPAATPGTIVGNITVTNGKITISKSSTQDVTVKGGLVLNDVVDATIQGKVVNENGTAITLNGGLLKIANTAVIEADKAIAATAGEVRVTSNSSTGVAAEISGDIDVADGVTKAFKGGVYDSDISALVTDPDYKAVEIEGKWVIVKKDYVAQIGEQKYETLAEAITAAPAGGTVKLLADTTLDKYTLSKKVVLDLNEFDLSSSVPTGGYPEYASRQIIKLIDGADLTVNGTNSTVSGNIYIGVKGGTTSSLVLNGGTYVNDTNSKSTLPLDDQATQACLQTLGTDKTGTKTIVLNGCTFTAPGTPIYLAGNADATFNDCAITGDQAVAMKGGSLVINGGTYTATGEETIPTAGRSNGINSSGAAIQIESNSSYSDITVEINDAVVVSENGPAVYEYLGSTKTAATRVKAIALKGGSYTAGGAYGAIILSDAMAAVPGLVGGELNAAVFSTDVSDYCEEGYAAKRDEATGTYAVIKVFTITYVDETGHGVAPAANSVTAAKVGESWQYALVSADLPKLTTEDVVVWDGWYNGETKAAAKQVITGDVTLKAKWKTALVKFTNPSGVVTYQAAIPANLSKGTYELLGNASVVQLTFGSTLVRAGEITFDLGGYTLTTTSANKKNVCTRSDANGIVATVRNGKIVTTANEDGVAVWLGGNNSTLTLADDLEIVCAEGSSVLIEGEGQTLNTAAKISTTGSNTAAIQTNGSTTKSTTINVTGGSITSENVAIYAPGEQTLNISGGTVTGTTAVEIRAGSLNVTGGTLVATAEEYSVIPNGNGSTTKGAAVAVAQHTTKKAIDVSVTGGSLTGVKSVSVANPQKNTTSNVAVELGADATYGGALAFSADGNAVVTKAEGAAIDAPEGYDWDANGKLVKVYPAEWPETNDATKAKFATWFASKGAGANLDVVQSQDAFLLNCTFDEVEDAKAAFKITSITQNPDGTWNVGAPEGEFNGKIVIKAYEDVGCTIDVLNPTGDETEIFWKAFLVFPAK